MEVDFNRDVRPILAAKCFACHGPDAEERKGDLRLDEPQSPREKGAIVPHRPAESELIRRILTQDADQRMPPADSGKPLTDSEKSKLEQWIAQGGAYTEHWAFVPPHRPAIPVVLDPTWSHHPIDRFVLARLEGIPARPSPQADRYTLVRRLYLDLIGLPPTPQEADAYVHDSRPDAYERLVDALLASPHYGERWARWWLDVARYSDTNGYEKDRPRSMWPYRDWVIQAFNQDMPFDQFSIEQLAGDMLPNATASQRVATGFHRNTMLNEEGGIDPLEFRFHAVVDRVATTGLVWLGLTTGCAQCHSHKYDPITQRDYYSLMAFLNNADEPDLLLTNRTEAIRRRNLEAEIANRTAQLIDHFPVANNPDPSSAMRRAQFENAFQIWLEKQHADSIPWRTLHPTKLTSNLPKLEVLSDDSVFSTGDITKRDIHTLVFSLRADHFGANNEDTAITALRLEVLPDDRLPARGPGRTYYEGRKGDFFLSELTAHVQGQPRQFATGSHSYGRIAIGSGSADAANVFDGNGSTGWSTAEREGEAHELVLTFQEPLPIPRDGTVELQLELLFERHFATSLGRYRVSATTHSSPVHATALPIEVANLLRRDVASLTAAERQQLQLHYIQTVPELAQARAEIDQLRQQLPAIPTAMVLQERAADNPRATFVHHRGEYLSPRESAEATIPTWLTRWTAHPPKTRLEFATWLVSPANPLVARVTVNRIWESFFGYGFVRSSGDFGTQSPAPTHPELLDWLASEFMSNGWSMKQLQRSIVLSATYQQSAEFSGELARNDPENRWLGRGPRFRLDAEIVRDALLRASGFLSENMYGPSVFPPQPASVTAVAFGDTAWNMSQGADRYRRSLYTFSKRTAPFAAFAIWDAPSGEQCTAQRDRSNTPLQALTLLNDAMFVELAQGIAASPQATPQERGSEIFRKLMTRPPHPTELTRIITFYEQQRARLEQQELRREEIAKSAPSHEEAAWVLVARALMNLDEAITR